MSYMDRLLPRMMIPVFAATVVLAGCGGSSPPPEKAAATPPPAAEQPATAETPAAAPEDAAAADTAKQEELAAKEQELSLREQQLALKEKEAALAKREADLAAQQAAAKKAASKPATAPVKSAPAPVVAKAPAPPPPPMVGPAATTFSASLVTPLSTKTNRRGDRVEAKLVSDIVVDGKLAVPAGAMVTGTVTDRVSGSKEIGATPKLAIAFDTLASSPDHPLAISSHISELGKSESGQDVAKIAGGAIAGAIIGHQVSKDRGTVIGGLLGAAAGTAAAKNTGSELELPAGTVFSLTLDSPVEVKH